MGEGPLTLATVAGLMDEGRRLVAAADRVVDLVAVTQVDSAALALVFGAQRQAGGQLTCVGLPDGFRSLAELYGVKELLPLA